MRLRPLLLAALLCSCHSAAPSRPSTSFAVSPVKLAEKPLPTQSPQDLFAKLAGKDLEASGGFEGGELLIDTSAPHAFVQAAHLSFADHRPLVLSPDMIWLLINQMAARRILAAPEECRAALTRNPPSAGKEELKVRRDDFILGSPKNDWRGVFAEFENKIQERCPNPSFVSDFSHPFSSSNVDTVAARRVTLMKGFSAYYTYTLATSCGIPEIRLEGQPEDWDWIRDHLSDLKLLKMDAQAEVLKPILEQFCAASRGHVDTAFWQSFYKYQSGSGGDRITGWITVFLRDEAVIYEGLLKYKSNWLGSNRTVSMPVDTVPRGDLIQDFKWQYGRQIIPMQFRAGFLGVSQDGLALRPEISWLVQKAKTPSALADLIPWLKAIKVSNREIYDEDYFDWMVVKELWAHTRGWKKQHCRGEIPPPPPKNPQSLTPEELKAQQDWRLLRAQNEEIDKKNKESFEALFRDRQFQDDILPLMTGLEEFIFWDWREAGLDFTPADAELLIKLPNLKRVIGNFTPECMAILKKKSGLEFRH